MRTGWFDCLPKHLRKVLAKAAPTCALWEYDFCVMAYRFRWLPAFGVTATQFENSKRSPTFYWTGKMVIRGPIVWSSDSPAS